jgi:hypothetical protein
VTAQYGAVSTRRRGCERRREGLTASESGRWNIWATSAVESVRVLRSRSGRGSSSVERDSGGGSEADTGAVAAEWMNPY